MPYWVAWSREMMIRALLVTIFAFCATATVTACAGTLIKSIDSLTLNPDIYQDKWLTVRGYIGIDEQGHQYLFSTLDDAIKKDFPKSIDLVPLPSKAHAMSPLTDKACAEIYGVFNAYGKKYLPTGYLLSNTGLIKVALVSNCPNLK